MSVLASPATSVDEGADRVIRAALAIAPHANAWIAADVARRCRLHDSGSGRTPSTDGRGR